MPGDPAQSMNASVSAFAGEIDLGDEVRRKLGLAEKLEGVRANLTRAACSMKNDLVATKRLGMHSTKLIHEVQQELLLCLRQRSL